jgi:hypothetical protein
VISECVKCILFFGIEKIIKIDRNIVVYTIHVYRKIVEN